ncbi:MAG TPA: N-formylglutamate amidohydrolase [Alphaproteobacteria bacterium]|nr:N-formylglutamate amidohydrolase [Alphaproteobacteria bacterium]
MDIAQAVEAPDPSAPDAFVIMAPARQTVPLVVASPHSGSAYPEDFVSAARLDRHSLRKSEDCFVDELFAAVPDRGAPLLKALFPRAYLDANREPYELDPGMFSDSLPAWANSRSPRVAAGLGTIPRVVANGEDIYRGKLRLADALGRIERLYRPYHAALAELVERTRQQFGFCLLLDCHSMPSTGGGYDRSRCDMVLGDCYGTACAPLAVDTAEQVLRRLGYAVNRNQPYAGGYTTRHYGRPGSGVHALQIELNRSLYMDEATLVRRPYFATLAAHMTELVEALGALALSAETA